jgi:predicted Zn finger-like uncharacterized protein
MIVVCGSCSKRYRFDAAKLRGRGSANLRCPACGTSISVTAPVSTGDLTTRLDADANQIPTSAKVPGGDPSLPPSRRISLAVLQGKDSGRIFPVEKPVVVLGRSEADVPLNDPEVSRQHASLEVHGARVVLRDLGSTNGTFINEVKVAQAELENRGEFRIGSTRLMLIMRDLESDLETLS